MHFTLPIIYLMELLEFYGLNKVELRRVPGASETEP